MDEKKRKQIELKDEKLSKYQEAIEKTLNDTSRKINQIQREYGFFYEDYFVGSFGDIKVFADINGKPLQEEEYIEHWNTKFLYESLDAAEQNEKFESATKIKNELKRRKLPTKSN